ncbi:hypothetical protein OWV82_015123 [Melia azedarach]|uniref:Uncharacterized protein n=1 Tax=Melia azedarach TaxID=155640 RepID=A0ACC1XQJ7_MELAZ|nr:hypothetical protein OWV82_015123 [Melia azedarach]
MGKNEPLGPSPSGQRLILLTEECQLRCLLKLYPLPSLGSRVRGGEEEENIRNNNDKKRREKKKWQHEGVGGGRQEEEEEVAMAARRKRLSF